MDAPGNVFIPDVTAPIERNSMADPKHRLPSPAQPDYDRQVLEIEGARAPGTPHKLELNTGSLSMKGEDSHDPYMRVPDDDRKRSSNQRTDLRKLSAWIKMMRSLEEAKKRRDEDD